MRNGRNLEKRQREGRGKGNKDKRKGCLRGKVGKVGNREEERKRRGRGRLIQKERWIQKLKKEVKRGGNY